MGNIQKAQRKTKALADWLAGRDYCDTRSLTSDMENAQRKINRITNNAIDDTLRNLERFIEQARLDAGDKSLSARYRQMARTELKRLRKTKDELRKLRV